MSALQSFSVSEVVCGVISHLLNFNNQHSKPRSISDSYMLISGVVLLISHCPPPSLCAGVGNVVSGQYRYMSDLRRLEATATGRGPSNFKPATPLHLPAWQRALAAHPDSTFASYILNGIAKGFHIGADRAVHLVPGHRNMLSVQQQPQLVASQIREETVVGRVLGPLPPHLANLTQTSPIGLIPKPHQPGKWRLIVDLSSPAGHSVNDAIPVDNCHTQYASVLANLLGVLGLAHFLQRWTCSTPTG